MWKKISCKILNFSYHIVNISPLCITDDVNKICTYKYLSKFVRLGFDFLSVRIEKILRVVYSLNESYKLFLMS
jgi:hypothetical protein